MTFDGFELAHIELEEVTLRVRHGGSGPPLLLLHGYPETHMMWALLADDLAREFTVVAPDLRGYGGSTMPVTAADHETSSKRAMARDAVGLMARLGFDRFAVAGHDRGGRVAYRLALDHPAAVSRLSVLDIIPTGEVWARADSRFALGYWHWGFLAQPNPFPESLISADPDFFFDGIAGLLRNLNPEAVVDYLEAAKKRDVIHGMCEDYRAGATYDRLLDEHDMKAARTIECPVQVLWGGKGALGAWYDVLQIWRCWAGDVVGQAVDCGHFLPEENPADTLAALRGFFAGST